MRKHEADPMESYPMEFNHKPVLLDEAVESLNIKPDGIYVDGTLGGAGHAFEICKRLNANGRFVGIDQDEDALMAARRRLSVLEAPDITIVKDNYVNIGSILDGIGIEKVDGILLDIGVSSYQLDTPERGFSYMEDAPLDMRMDITGPLSAKTVVNEYDESDLYRIIRDYGEDNFAKNIAKHIVAARREAPIETTGRLAEIIKQSIPAKIRMTGGHPAKRTFQALRIEVNRELEVLEKSIDVMTDRLNPDGRLSIITFHSLEDRIVKNKFKSNENPCICPPTFPVCVCGRVSKGRRLYGKPVIPGEKELSENKRAKSSKLRTFVRNSES